jgi:hypothetical protein
VCERERKGFDKYRIGRSKSDIFYAFLLVKNHACITNKKEEEEWGENEQLENRT